MTADPATTPSAGLPDVSHYTYRIGWSGEDGEFVATCAEFPSLSWLDADQVVALRSLQVLIADIVTEMAESGEVIPQPLADRVFSGRLNLRLGSDLHRRVALAAAEAGVSLNSYLLGRLAG